MMHYIIQIVFARTITTFHTPLADMLPYIKFKVYPSLFKFHTISHHDLQTILVYQWSENELLITTINFRLGLSITSLRSSPSHCTNHHWQGPMLSLPEQDRDPPRSWMAALEGWSELRIRLRITTSAATMQKSSKWYVSFSWVSESINHSSIVACRSESLRFRTYDIYKNTSECIRSCRPQLSQVHLIKCWFHPTGHKELLPPHQIANSTYYHMRRTMQDYIMSVVFSCLP